MEKAKYTKVPKEKKEESIWKKLTDKMRYTESPKSQYSDIAKSLENLSKQGPPAKKKYDY